MEAFEIDREYDRDNADTGTESRFGNYVRGRMRDFAESWDGSYDDGTVHFARTAWYVATSPVMAPGYVRRHPRVLSAQIVRNEWDGSLAADVSLVIPQPKPLRYMLLDEDRRLGAMWRDWPSEHPWGGGEVFLEPSGEDVTRNHYLMASARLCFPMPATQQELPLPSEDWARGGIAEEAARQVVAILVRGLNETVGPVLNRIEGN